MLPAEIWRALVCGLDGHCHCRHFVSPFRALNTRHGNVTLKSEANDAGPHQCVASWSRARRVVIDVELSWHGDNWNGDIGGQSVLQCVGGLVVREKSCSWSCYEDMGTWR
jgi:hypothetical protein